MRKMIWEDWGKANIQVRICQYLHSTSQHTQAHGAQQHSLTFILQAEDTDKCATHKSLQLLLRRGFNEPAFADHIPGTHLGCSVSSSRLLPLLLLLLLLWNWERSKAYPVLVFSSATPKEEVKKLITLTERERARAGGRQSSALDAVVGLRGS